MHRPLREDLDGVLRRTPCLFEGLAGARIFVTGGTGFFGAWLLESFHHANAELELGAEITVLTRDPARFHARFPHLEARTRVVVGDVRSFEFPRGRFTHVIHGAADSAISMSPSNAGDFLETIVAGTQRALEFAGLCNAEQFLHISSGAVYGDRREPCHEPMFDASAHHDSIPLFGTDPASLKRAYGEAKRTAEALCAAHHGLKTMVARCFAFAGPHLPLDSHFAFGNFVRDAVAGSPIEVHGDGSPVRSYMYAADLTSWLWTILVRGEQGQAYNVGSEREVRIGELARMVAESIEPRLDVRLSGRRDHEGAPGQRYVPCTARVQEELGLRETYSLEETIRLTVRHFAGIRQADSNPNGDPWLRSELETPPLAMASRATSLRK